MSMHGMRMRKELLLAALIIGSMPIPVQKKKHEWEMSATGQGKCRDCGELISLENFDEKINERCNAEIKR